MKFTRQCLIPSSEQAQLAAELQTRNADGSSTGLLLTRFSSGISYVYVTADLGNKFTFMGFITSLLIETLTFMFFSTIHKFCIFSSFNILGYKVVHCWCCPMEERKKLSAHNTQVALLVLSLCINAQRSLFSGYPSQYL